MVEMSHPAPEYLFEGGFYGGCDHERVVVEAVPDGTPLPDPERSDGRATQPVEVAP
jgi:hypothetical protein